MKNTMIKKVLCAALVTGTVLTASPIISTAESTTACAAATAPSSNTASLAAIKEAFPENSYWNSCYDAAWQCHGWALNAAFVAYGQHAKYDWPKTYRPANPVLKAGDIVSYYRTSAKSGNKTHTVIITSVNSDGNVTVAECNYSAKNRVSYGRKIPDNFIGSGGWGIEYVWSAPYALSTGSEPTKSDDVIPVKALLNNTVVPIFCYNVRQTSIPVYTDSALKNRKGNEEIWKTDRCTILGIYGNSLYVKYPAGSSFKERYVSADAFFVSSFASPANFKNNATVYTSENMSTKIGVVYRSDSGNSYIIGQKGSSVTQILYPINGGWKMGFVYTSNLL